jgi:hypothetical protein
MTTYQVDVTASTHDLLKQGVTEMPVVGGQCFTTIVLAAEVVESDFDAELFARQWVQSASYMCTSSRLVSWPVES